MRSALQAYITALDVRDQDPAARKASNIVIAAGSTPDRNAQYTVERLRGMAMSLPQIQEMRRRREVPLTIDIRSPADGVVLARNITLGQKFEKGAEWFRIANLERGLDPGRRNRGRRSPDPRRHEGPGDRTGSKRCARCSGRSSVPPQFDPSRTTKIRLEVANPGGMPRPDMYVDVTLEIEHPQAVTVPVDAVVDSGLRRTVFVETGAGFFEPRAIETGWRAGNRVEILGPRAWESRGLWSPGRFSWTRRASSAPRPRACGVHLPVTPSAEWTSTRRKHAPPS